MTKTTRILIRAAALTLLLALVATATAAPGKCNPKKEDCSTTTTVPPTTTTVAPGPRAGFSCEEYVKLNASDPNPRIGDPLTWNTEVSDTFVFEPDSNGELKSGLGTCIDFSSTAGGELTVTIDSVDSRAGRNSILYALVKDSHAGDHCGTAEGGPGSALILSLKTGATGTIGDIPAATLNACGTGYAEADIEWNGEDGEWVVSPTTAKDGTPDPLVIMLGISGRPGITANVTLEYE
jgi:hypothetical protein